MPQGSVLRPLLFLVYINDIVDSLQSTAGLFADNLSHNKDIIETRLNSDLENILQWSKQWLVNFNPTKTEVIALSLSDRDLPKLNFDNTELTYVNHHKHLSITLSNDGS